MASTASGLSKPLVTKTFLIPSRCAMRAQSRANSMKMVGSV